MRVWENVIEPGAESPLHRHDHDYLVIDLEGERLRFNPVADGHFAAMDHEVTPGMVPMLLPGGTTETASNIESRRYRTILVELLDNPR